MGTIKVDFLEGDDLPDGSVVGMGGLVVDAKAMTADQLAKLKAFIQQNGLQAVGAIVHPPPTEPDGGDPPEDPPPPPPPPPPPSGP